MLLVSPIREKLCEVSVMDRWIGAVVGAMDQGGNEWLIHGRLIREAMNG